MASLAIMGVASAALITGLLIDTTGWRSAFLIPGIVAVLLGLIYLIFEMSNGKAVASAKAADDAKMSTEALPKHIVIRVFVVILITAALGGVIFQSTTFSLPKVLDERLADLAGSASLIGVYSFMVFSVAAFAQLVVGYLVDNYSIRTVFMWIALLQVVFFALMIQLTGVPALIVAIAFMLVVFGEIPINDVLVGRG